MVARSNPVSQANAASGPAKPPSAHIDDADVEAIPEAPRKLKVWVVWKWVWKADKNKWDKPPIDPKTGIEVDQTDPKNWMMFDPARRAARKNGDGIGIALGPPDKRIGLVPLDLDHCIDPSGLIDSTAMRIVQDFKSYTERTPSGSGLRVLIWGRKPGPRCRTKDFPNVEIYESDRYITVSGRHLQGTPTEIENRQDALDALYAEMFPPEPSGQSKSNGQPSGPIDASDDELLDKARNARNGSGDKFKKLFDQGDISDYPSPSEADQALCNLLAFWTGRDANRMETLFGRSALGKRDKWLKRSDYRGWTLDKAIDDCSEVYSPRPPRAGSASSHSRPSANGHKLPEIVVTTEEHKIIDAAVSALKAESNLFQRGGALVTVLADCKPKPKRHDPTRPPGSLRIAVLPSAQIRRLMTVHAEWKKPHKDRSGAWEIVPSHPPSWAVEGVATLGTWTGIKPIEGISEVPTLRLDGSLIRKPGYDEDTAIWFAPNGDFPPMPDQPTLADAQGAVNVLYEPINDFPFADPVKGKATWLAALLTPLGRWAIDGPCPLFLFDANCPGTGKSKLCDIIAILLTGREMPRGDHPDDQAEMQKTLLSIAMGGDRLVLFDNVATGAAIGGSALDRVLTARTMKGRILGRSEMTPELPVDVVFYATGNNLGIKGDALRRVVPCRPDTNEERPEERRNFTIPGDLLTYVKLNRGRLVTAALTILRVYVVAGRPDQKLIPMDYSAWCGLIRNAVNWATGIDPCAARKELVANDEEMNESAALLAGWKALCEAESKTSLSVAAALKALDDDQIKHASLRAILSGWSKDGKLPSARTIGQKFNRIRGRNIHGSRLECSFSVGVREWYVKVTPNQPIGANGANLNPSAGNFAPTTVSARNPVGGKSLAPSAPLAPTSNMDAVVNHVEVERGVQATQVDGGRVIPPSPPKGKRRRVVV